MGEIRKGIGFEDKMTPVLKSIIESTKLANHLLNQLNTSAPSSASLTGLQSAVNDTNTALHETIVRERKVEEEAKKAKNQFSGWQSTLMGVNSALEIIQKGAGFLGGLIDKADRMTALSARIGLINDGLQTNAQLERQIFQAAQRSRGAYDATAGSIAKMGSLAKDAFSSNDEIIRFSELLNKSFKLSGASASEMSGAMTQLTQGLASGTLRGDELNSVLENGGMIAGYIADYLSVPKGKLREIATEGGLTADVVKNAMFAATDDINNKFSQLPMTFSDIKTQIGNSAAMAFKPAVDAFNKLLQNENAQKFVKNFISFMDIAGQAVERLIYGVNWLFDVISAGMPYILGVLAVLVLYYLPAMVMPILVSAAAWLLWNWPLLLIIGAVMLLIFILCKLGVSAEDVAGFVGGVFGALFGMLHNGIAATWNNVAAFAEFFANVFNDPVGSVVRLFHSLADNVLGVIQTIASGIDFVFRSNLAGAVSGLRSKLSDWTMNAVGEAKYKVERMEYVDLSDSITGGMDKAVGLLNGLSGFGNLTDFDYGSDLSSPLQDGGNIGGINDSVKVTSEDLKAIKEMAEQRYINQFTNLAPNINITFGDVRETADIDAVKDRIERSLLESLAVVSEGVPS